MIPDDTTAEDGNGGERKDPEFRSVAGLTCQACQACRGRDDDGAGSRDAAERRRRQNRANQRAWRRRKALQASERALAAVDQGHPSSGFWVLKPVVAREDVREDRPVCHLSPATVQLVTTLLRYHQDHGVGQALPLHLFPLSLDHCLLTLIQYNVLRAIVTNMSILSATTATTEASSFRQILQEMHPPLPPAASAADLPPALRPTPLQLSTPHEYWMDSAPAAGMRDALIRHAGAYDLDELCGDMLGGLFGEAYRDVERCGILVWSDPWSIDGWEVTEGFARKWTFLLTGCEALIAATNRHRARRGEGPLVASLEAED